MAKKNRDIKASLADCLAKLAPSDDRAKHEIDTIMHQLNDSSYHIQNNEAGLYESCHALRLIFTQSPAMMNDQNKSFVSQFEKEVFSQSKTAKPFPKTK